MKKSKKNRNLPKLPHPVAKMIWSFLHHHNNFSNSRLKQFSTQNKIYLSLSISDILNSTYFISHFRSEIDKINSLRGWKNIVQCDPNLVHIAWRHTKGQKISEVNFLAFNSSKKTTQKLSQFLP